MKRTRLQAPPALAAALLLAPLAALNAAEEPAVAGKPNIICILADDCGISGVGCYGGSYKTPQLDAMASGGLRFENCYTSPWCGPSRAALLMGRYAFRTGMNSNGAGNRATPPKEICFANVMKQAGYATAVAGKWSQLTHMGTRQEGHDWGFDEFMVWIGAPKIPRYWNPTFSIAGFHVRLLALPAEIALFFRLSV
jgi:arylsulfatase A